MKWLHSDRSNISCVLRPQSKSVPQLVMSSAKSQRNQVSKVARQPRCMKVEVKKMKQLLRAVQNLSSQSASGARSLQARSASDHRTSRGCKQCLHPAGSRHGCQEAKVHRALKLLEQMGGRVGDFLSQPKRSIPPPPATSMDFVPGSQQSIESLHPVTHVRTAYRIGDHVYSLSQKFRSEQAHLHVLTVISSKSLN